MTTTDPKTGWPVEFEAAVRLGHPEKMFAALVVREAEGNAEVVRVWVCKLLRSRGRKQGRGSEGKRRYREWWHPYALVVEDGSVATDWIQYSQAKSRAERLSMQVWEAKSLPDTVHIVWEDPDSVSEKT